MRSRWLREHQNLIFSIFAGVLVVLLGIQIIVASQLDNCTETANFEGSTTAVFPLKGSCTYRGVTMRNGELYAVGVESGFLFDQSPVTGIAPNQTRLLPLHLIQCSEMQDCAILLDDVSYCRKITSRA